MRARETMTEYLQGRGEPTQHNMRSINCKTEEESQNGELQDGR